MVWVGINSAPGANHGQVGRLARFSPEAALATDYKQIALPSGVNVVDMQSSWTTYGELAVNCGGFTDNLILTRHWQAWRLGMRPPNNVPDVVLAAGPGITANVICYLRGYDRLTEERSPLSAASATLAAANQKITYQNLDLVELDTRWTHLEGWESRDGGLPRFVWRRQIGVVTVTHAKALGDLGEAETSDWTKPPRCRYAAVFHDRLCMAGDDDNPDTVYIMEIGAPERWAGFTLRTRSGQPVVGLAEINGVLLVGCPSVIERISGWTEDDLKIEIVQHSIGLVSHHSFVQTHGWLWMVSQSQPFITDGISWFPMGLDIKPYWAAEYRTHRAAYERMWAEHHEDEHVVRWYVGDITDVQGAFCYWVADYESVFPQEGGSLGQPAWSIDAYGYPKSCGARLAVPGSRRRDVYTGGEYGMIWREAQDIDHDTGRTGVNYDKPLTAVSGAQSYGQLGGDERHALQLDRVDTIVRAELNAWEFSIFSGDVEAYQTDITPPSGPAFGPLEVVASATEAQQPEWTHAFGDLANVSGFAFVYRIHAARPRQMRFAGIVAYWSTPGSGHRQPGTTGGE